jgi:hypothetical protein
VAGGAPAAFASGDVGGSSLVRGERLHADAAHLYFVSSGLRRLRHDRADEPAWPREPVRANQLAVGETHACAVGDGALRCASKETGEVALLARGFDPEEVEIAVGRDDVFACDYTAEILVAVPLSGGPPELVDDACHLGTKLLVDGDALYVMEIGGVLHRYTGTREVDEILSYGALAGLNRTSVWIASDDNTLFASIDVTRSRVLHVDLRQPLAEDPTIYEGCISSFALSGPVESSTPVGRSGFVGWIETEDLTGIELRLASFPTAVTDAIRTGAIALRLVCPDRARAETTRGALRARLGPTWGGDALRVIVDAEWPVRGSARQVEVVVDLREVARAFTPPSVPENANAELNRWRRALGRPTLP